MKVIDPRINNSLFSHFTTILILKNPNPLLLCPILTNTNSQLITNQDFCQFMMCRNNYDYIPKPHTPKPFGFLLKNVAWWSLYHLLYFQHLRRLHRNPSLIVQHNTNHSFPSNGWGNLAWEDHHRSEGNHPPTIKQHNC